ncbi:MAG: ATP-binding cassette domain-containing protein [Bacteroidetes bacterium]|nr:ATP-binding cassette domain-containing protein [Bacteroidota bacterium]
MNRNLFEIEGLECAYGHRGNNNRKVVLQIEKLSIPMGKVSMILGLSGSGKSTLIETLGLMNNTISKGSITYYQGENSVTIDRKIWEHPSVLTEIRNRNFSFIFQQDFLMPHYSTEENMLIGRLIQGSDPELFDEKDELRQVCQKMRLNFDEISKKKPFELSVGQKQRLSFIRAILKPHSVIFGDEPTGNLDDINSELLMNVLKESVNQDHRRSAILVSHNIPLSIAKADYIFVLSPVSGDIFEVKPGHVFSRFESGWINGNKEVLTDIKLEEKIREAVNFNEPV